MERSREELDTRLKRQIHAQDHLMTSMLARELITELIELHEKLKA